MVSFTKSRLLFCLLSLILAFAFILCGCGKADGNASSSVQESSEESAESKAVGYGLYIDGRFIAAAEAVEDISASLESVLDMLSLSYGVKSEASAISNDIRTVKGEYLAESFVDSEYLTSLLGCSDGVLSFEVFDCYGEKTDVTFAVDTVITVDKSEPFMLDTVYRETDLFEVGESVTVTEAIEGEAVNTYEVTMKNGVVTAEQLVGSKVTKDALASEVWLGNGTGATLMSASAKFGLPYNGKISSWYGWRTVFGEADFHQGLDFVAYDGGCYGDPIYASADGVVTFSGTKGGYGKLAILSHSQSTQSYYAHCSKLLVEEGQTVKKGDVIALVGNSGRVTGTHLHFGIMIDGEFVDPKEYLDWTGFLGEVKK